MDIYYVSKDKKNIERAYVIPEEELYGVKTVSIYNNPSRQSKWEKFRINEELYNGAYHDLVSYIRDKKYFGIKEINEWLAINCDIKSPIW